MGSRAAEEMGRRDVQKVDEPNIIALGVDSLGIVGSEFIFRVDCSSRWRGGSVEGSVWVRELARKWVGKMSKGGRTKCTSLGGRLFCDRVRIHFRFYFVQDLGVGACDVEQQIALISFYGSEVFKDLCLCFGCL